VSLSRSLREEGMTQTTPSHRLLPHHRLVAYSVSLELLVLTRNAAIKDPKLRDQAMRAAKSVCLNTAEAAGRTSPADKARVFGIARGEVLEVAAALEIAVLSGDCDANVLTFASPVVDRLYSLLTGLSR
jgi:four helix bundle protein